MLTATQSTSNVSASIIRAAVLKGRFTSLASMSVCLSRTGS